MQYKRRFESEEPAGVVAAFKRPEVPIINNLVKGLEL